MNLNMSNVGVWGFRHYEYFKQNRPSTVCTMRLNYIFGIYLKDVNQEATKMLELLIRQFAKTEGVTPTLKQMDQLEWLIRMKIIPNSAEEVALNEIIY